MMLRTVWKVLLIALVLGTFGQSGGIPLDDLALLRYTRRDIQFPIYTPEDRSEIVQQAQLLFSMYVNRDVKMAAYGPQVDPVPRLEALAAKAPTMKDVAFHMEMSSIFSSLRDLHQTYMFPVPYSCYRVFLPLRFNRVFSNNTHIYVVSKKYGQYTDKFGKGWLDKIEVGDVLSSVDGMAISLWVERMVSTFGGANEDGGYARAIEGLTFRSLSHRPVPNSNQATLGFVGQNGLYIQTLDYLVYPISKKCTQPVKQAIEPTLKPFRLDIAEYATGKDVNELFGLPSFHLDQMGIFDLKNSSEGIIKYTKLNYIWGTFGYISLETFLPNMGDTEAAVKTLRGLLTNELKNTNGLIMDVRNNPGGAIQLAEKVPQLFSQGHVVPSTIRALNVLLNKRIFESGDKDFTGTPWPTIFNSTPVTSEWTQPSVMISNETLINEAGRAYFKPVAVLTNALCYSACELFVAAMQDWKLATIYGEDRKTGGGGANVMVNWNFNKYLPDTFKLSLPGYQSMSLAWRQSMRSGLKQGQLIEDRGVDVDALAQPRKPDIQGKSQTQLDMISFKLRLQDPFSKSPVLNVDGPLIRDVAVNKTIQFTGTGKGVYGIVAFENGKIIGFTSVNMFGKWRISLPGPTAFVTSRRIYFEAFDKGSVPLFTIERTIRVIPNSILVLKRHQHFWQPRKPFHWTWDFQMGPTVSTYLLAASKPDQGWNVLDGMRLAIGNGLQYEPGVKAVTSIFLDLKHVKQASVSIRLELDLAPGDKVEFEVAIPPIPLPVEWFGSREGRIPFATLNFDLDKYCGKNTVEFRIVFRSRITSKPLGYRGVSVYQLKVSSD